MVDPILIDPWGSSLVEDYEKLIKEFGLSSLSPLRFPHPNRLMRRNVTFAEQDMDIILDYIKKKKKYYALTGVMPTGERIHLGNKMTIENLRYFQEHGAQTYVLVADLEAAAARGVSLEEAKKRAMNFHIPAYIALGLDPKKTKFYFQSENVRVIQTAFEASKRFTLNEFRSAYGTADPGKIMSSLTQTGDMLFPQEEERMPGVIPVAIDQAVHIRICRDYIRKAKEKKYFMISSTYNKFTPSLDGNFKMSKSMPESCIEIPEEKVLFTRKIQQALTGGRNTKEEQRKLGAEIEKDMVFELLKQHLIEDDKELNKVYHDYKTGKMLSSELKQLAIEKMDHFMKNFNKRFEKAQKQAHKIKFIKE